MISSSSIWSENMRFYGNNFPAPIRSDFLVFRPYDWPTLSRVIWSWTWSATICSFGPAKILPRSLSIRSRMADRKHWCLNTKEHRVRRPAGPAPGVFLLFMFRTGVPCNRIAKQICNNVLSLSTLEVFCSKEEEWNVSNGFYARSMAAKPDWKSGKIQFLKTSRCC